MSVKCALLFTLLLFCATALESSAFIKLQGYIPDQLDVSMVKSEYERIWRTLLPKTPPDTSELYINYYHHRSGQHYGVRLPEWGGGGAIGKDSIIIPVNKAPILNMDYMQITSHELVHIIVNRGFGTVHIPRWLHEGLAMVLSGEMPLEGQKKLSATVWWGKLLSLDTIEHVNRFNESSATLAYAQSHASVLFLIENYGIDGIEELLEIARKRRGFDDALWIVYGLSKRELEHMIGEFIVARYKLAILSEEGFIWVFIGFLALLAILVSQLRNRKKLKIMIREELEMIPPAPENEQI